MKETYKLYMDEVEKFPLLSRKEERELLTQCKAGSKEAFNKLYESNLKFVVKTAFKYNIKCDIMDLIQAGNLGLAEAIKKFDLNNKERFITYAVWWIRQKILEELAHQGHFIKLSTESIIIKANVEKFNHKFQQKHERLPILQELIEGTKYTKEELERIYLQEGQPSLDMKVRERNNNNITTLSDLIEDNNTMSPENFHLGNVEEKILDFLEKANVQKKIDDTEKEIVKKYYGVGIGGITYTLAELGEIHDEPAENIRKTKLRTLKKLKGFSKIEEMQNKECLSLDMV